MTATGLCPCCKNRRIPSVVIVSLCIVSFLAGSIITAGIRIEKELLCDSTVTNPATAHVQALVQQRLAEERQKIEEQRELYDECSEKVLKAIHQERLSLKKEHDAVSSVGKVSRFPTTVNKYAAGLARVPKDNFTDTFDLGVPLDKTQIGNEDVLIWYKRPNALPTAQSLQTTMNGEIPRLSAQEATVNCDSMHVMMTDAGSRRQCIAIVPQYQSYHIQNWMRVPTDGKGKVEASEKLQFVSRGYQSNGRQQFKPPHLERHSKPHFGMLRTYLESLDSVLTELKPLAKSVAKDNTVVVVVCNHGQSELLMNFACASKSRRLPTDQVLVFATDQETKELAESVGLKAFFDKKVSASCLFGQEDQHVAAIHTVFLHPKNFGNIPSEAATRYGDKRFAKMMMAKVYCVQLISMLGYDLLFQDVDIVWFRNPLDFFKNDDSSFDVYFQDDGQHSVRYAPYAANSGFYFVRHNARTRHFFTTLLLTSDLVLSTKSHQQALVSLLSEHASLYGLRVKVLSRDRDEFPGGYQYHQKSGRWMHEFFAGQRHPYIFHMSWTENKNNKLLFLKQMGEWYVRDACVGQTVQSIGGASCCSAEALISCHYRDKPSKIPCEDSPNIDQGGSSFWKS